MTLYNSSIRSPLFQFTFCFGVIKAVQLTATRSAASCFPVRYSHAPRVAHSAIYAVRVLIECVLEWYPLISHIPVIRRSKVCDSIRVDAQCKDDQKLSSRPSNLLAYSFL